MTDTQTGTDAPTGTGAPTGMDTRTGGFTRVSRVINARAADIYAAFIDPEALLDWLPPGEMTGAIHAFDARVGGGYRMSLYYPPSESADRGKTSAREDMVTVRFVELTPPSRIVEAVTFHATDPAFLGEMTVVVTLTLVLGGIEVAMLCENLPPGILPADNEAGSRLSLEQLASRFE